MIDLTEEQGRELFENVESEDLGGNISPSFKLTLKRWKQKGYIKKSALEEARELHKKVLFSENALVIEVMDYYHRIIELYEKVIKDTNE